jgi:nitrite reductase/ring-hydroxylating ferredoxin subunit
MNKKHYICKLEILKKERYFVKWIDDWKDELIVFLGKNDEVKIFSSICPHFGGEIHLKKNQVLSCKWHAWKFCLETGKCFSNNLRLSLKPYDFEVLPVNIKNNGVQLIEQEIYAINDEK